MKSAEREMISSLTDPNDRSRLCTVACVTRAEALAKVGSWRRESIELLLAEPCLAQLCECELSDEGLCVRVVEAKRILDDHADNIYHQLRILRRAVLLTTAWLAMVTLGLWLVVVFAEVPETVSPPNSPLRDGTLMLVVMLLGAAGAYLSSATRLASRNDDQRIPEIRVSHVLMAMRPVVGAASAVLVVVLVQSSLGPTVTLESTAVFGIAVAAGFTERLATRVVNSAVDSVGK